MRCGLFFTAIEYVTNYADVSEPDWTRATGVGPCTFGENSPERMSDLILEGERERERGKEREDGAKWREAHHPQSRK